jgi:hypothetical protein
MTMIWTIQKIFSSFTSFSDAETKPWKPFKYNGYIAEPHGLLVI